MLEVNLREAKHLWGPSIPKLLLKTGPPCLSPPKETW